MITNNQNSARESISVCIQNLESVVNRQVESFSVHLFEGYKETVPRERKYLLSGIITSSPIGH